VRERSGRLIGVIESAIGSVRAPIGMVLGSGLGGLADEIEDARVVPYRAIPHLPMSTVPGHAGRLVAGSWQGREVVVLSGRIHRYEGHDTAKVALPVQMLAAMGVDTVFVTNAAGAVNASYNPGDLMLISDHINLIGGNPLVGMNDDRIGPRFPDMTVAYDAELRASARAIAAKLGITLHEGVYCGVLGPSYETPAEIRMVRTLGADAIGMSTVPEVIAARHAGMRVLGLSCLTNMGAGMSGGVLDHGEVKEVAGQATR
jgi:purine-nucleoside phosphorylase